VGVTVDTTQILRATNLPRLDTLSRPLLSLVDSAAAPSPPIATIGDSTFTLDQLARHVMQTDGGARMTVGEVLDDFLDTKTFQYAGARLEEQDPSFAAKMKEYREGLLAFQFMQDSVWTAAAQDSSGLRAYFENRRDRYRFPDRVRTLVLRAPDDSLLHSYSDSVETPIAFGALADSAAADSLVSVDTTMVTDESPDVYQTVLSMTDSSRTGPIDHDGRALLLARDRQLPARQKTFAEARSSVVRDYQDQYEDEVLRRLRQRYDADTHPDRLRAAFRNQ
jgi:peptidyl-prolyl cis-trans isomerase SurA